MKGSRLCGCLTCLVCFGIFLNQSAEILIAARSSEAFEEWKLSMFLKVTTFRFQRPGFTSSKGRPDDPPYGLDPVIHVRLRVCHEQEGFMADRCTILISCSTWREKLGKEGEKKVEVSTAEIFLPQEQRHPLLVWASTLILSWSVQAGADRPWGSRHISQETVERK